ncbi:MAG TPA: hypothetical protein PKC39_15570 [Ferruginibacter sp.]|nr:hypothetical protein [Ferruginibacter sp.]HMP22378.1 hypothetical protein [Ferruginibacter sp.]
MNTLLLIPLISIFLSCNQDEPKFLRKQIDNKDIVIKWYYHSYITNNSPDFVVAEKNGNKKEIYKATWVILNVTLQDSTIILKLVEPSKNLVFTKKVDEEVFGYKIKLDTTGTYEELMRIPDGVKEGN